MNKTFIVKERINTNPWLPKYVDVEFSRKKITSIVNELIKECEGKDYSASYSYNKHVESVVRDHWSKESGNIKTFYQALLHILRETEVVDNNNWHDGNIAARRVIETKLAYLTPGFVEAKRYSEF
ncbi:MAG: hypothetical protein EBY39_10965 [Flavobacteriia bacterium]|nr:hypothetical protein [Flavobacteriia bacterium]